AAPPSAQLRARSRKLDEVLAGAGPMVGIASGLLAVVVSLAGPSAAAARLPLALLATAMVVLAVVRRPDHPQEPSRWYAAASVFAADGVAHEPRAGAHAAFVGLSAAALLLTLHLLARARRDVEAEQARTASALATSARVLRGDGAATMDAPMVKPGQEV